jgi:hypothetical protein
MTISDETLMTYADGELDAAAREAVESAMREDPQIAARIARHRALRLRVQTAYAAELSEDVPRRLLTAAKGAAHRRRWRTAGSLAASVVIGVGVGFLIWGRAGAPFVRGTSGELLARGPLAQALSSQLMAEQSSRSDVLIGLSFLAKSGDYCRTFALTAAVPQSGLACRRGEGWQVQALVQGSSGSSSDYRTAGSSMPAAILTLVESQISGEALDAAGEKAARRRDWNAEKR